MSSEPPRLAIVTGAASGLGRAFCRRLAASGEAWHIIAVDVNALGAEETLAEIRRSRRSDGQVEPFDVSEAQAWVNLRDRLQRDWPRLDLLVNNAGVCFSAEVGDGSLEAWRRLTEINYYGVLNGCHVMTSWLKQTAFENLLEPETSGRQTSVINVASILGVVATPSSAAYCGAKAAVIALSEAMHAELWPHGVQVTVTMPGFFRSSLLESGKFAAPQHREQADRFVETSTIDADQVAREALRAAARRQLYAVTGNRARWYWRLKRLAPGLLTRKLARRYFDMMKPFAE